MSECIKKMAAVSAIRKYEFGKCPEYMQDWATKLKRAILQDVVDDVMEIPAADVAPVVHGKWVKNADDDNIVYCDQCLMPQDMPTNYCHNCGARMDGDG